MKRSLLFSLCLFVLAGCGNLQKKPTISNTDVLPPPTTPLSSAARQIEDGDEKDAEIEEIEKIQNLHGQSGNDLDTVDGESKIPVEINGLVTKWMEWFQGRGRGHMERYLSRSARYLPMMKKILKERGLPEDLVYIALIESGFSPIARSHAGAVGYWQFMPGTGRDYGLKINNLIDERRDPVLATQAAADYFSGLYNLFGSWYLAMAAYNVGENRIKRVVMQEQTRDFWEIARSGRLPKETVNYVPKFIAAKLIAKDPKKYGFEDVDYKNPYAYDEIRVEGTISLRRMAKSLDITEDEIRYLNPMFRTDYAQAARGAFFNLRVPVGLKERADVAVASAQVRDLRRVAQESRLEEGSVARYRVKRGDTLSQVAARFGVSISQLAKTNRLSPRANLRVGQTLVISKGSVAKSNEARKLASKSRVHVVRRGDTLSAISRRYRVPIREIADANNIRSKSRLMAGERLRIPN